VAYPRVRAGAFASSPAKGVAMALREFALVSGLMLMSPSIAIGGPPTPPTLPTIVVNKPESPVPVQGSVAVTMMPRENEVELFDQSVQCFGIGPSYQCDAKWQGSVIIESLSAHCQGSGAMVRVLKVISSMSLSAGFLPADKLSASPGPGATAAEAREGGRRFLPLTWIPSLDPSVIVSVLTPVPLRILVPQDRFVRVIFEGDMGSTSCVVAFSGRWLN
jgi:hypothetical protein